MILGLPIKGKPMYMKFINTGFDGWREQMDALIGMTHVEPEDKAKRVPLSATYKWIVQNFARCPAEADEDEDTIKVYIKVYVWYLISGTLFAYGGGKMA
jgi:hypothetical protein